MKNKKTLFLIFLVIINIVLLASCSKNDFDMLPYEYHAKEKSRVFSSDQQLIGELYNENRTYVTLDKIPVHLEKAIIAVEDSRFNSHSGFDIVRIVKAIFVDIKAGEFKEGASTITQQLAKNLFLTNEKSFNRKIKELFYSIQLEKKYSKDEILEMYLNEIYLGQLVYGVQEASIRFLGKDVCELSLAESALLAGLPQAPSAYDPTKHFERAKKRQEIVLNRMVVTEDITQEQADQAKKEEIEIIANKDQTFKGKYKKGNQHFINQVVNELIHYFSEDIKKRDRQNFEEEEIYEMAKYEIENGGYKIYTTLNQSIQEQAILAIKDGIKKNHLGEETNGVLVSIEPITGKILAYYGGVRDIDMAEKPRRPGSTIKPLYFGAAINEGLIDRNTILLDELTNFDGHEYKNYGNKYLGYVTARETLVHSLNNASVKVMNNVGIEKTMEYLEKYGISTIMKEDYQLATALGGMTYGIKPIELTNAYATIANDGLYQEAYFIEKVEDSTGKIIYSKEDQQLKTQQVLSENAAMEIEDILIDAVNRGTGSNARLPYYTAGKTGTTNNKEDLWFVGFVDSLVTTIWLGNEDHLEIQASSGVSASLYKQYMNSILDNKLISKNDLKAVTNYEEIITITILLAEKNKSELPEITEEDIADIVIPSKEYVHFQDNIVERIAIDSTTGKLFAEGRCPEENKEIKIYLKSEVPKEECETIHFFDKFHHFYDNLKLKNKNDHNAWNTWDYIN